VCVAILHLCAYHYENETQNVCYIIYDAMYTYMFVDDIVNLKSGVRVIIAVLMKMQTVATVCALMVSLISSCNQ
jgi:hypothetical protein